MTILGDRGELLRRQEGLNAAYLPDEVNEIITAVAANTLLLLVQFGELTRYVVFKR